MKKNIAIITTSIGNFGKYGFYNMQEIGLAKVLANFCNRVDFYRCIDINETGIDSLIEETKNVYIHLIPSRHLGSNGFFDLNKLIKDTNIIINCTDTQLDALNIYKYARNNNIDYYPYIGVLESHSSNIIVSSFINLMSRRNRKIYRNSLCLAKTVDIQEKLYYVGAKKVVHFPVALDLSTMYSKFETVDKNELKESLGLNKNENYILYVGRLEEEKRPLEVVNIFRQVKTHKNEYKLLIIGKGSLANELNKMIISANLKDDVFVFSDISYKEMWKYYWISDYLINLNDKEIFGMAILEAMYYENTVIAFNAPGPNEIIKNGYNGFIVNSIDEIIKLIINNAKCNNSHEYIISNYCWENRVSLLSDIIHFDE